MNKKPVSGSETSHRTAPSLGESADTVAFLRLPKVRAITGLSKTTIYEKIREETFPSPIPIGKRSVGWVESEVRQWAHRQVEIARAMDRAFTKERLPVMPAAKANPAFRKSA